MVGHPDEQYDPMDLVVEGWSEAITLRDDGTDESAMYAYTLTLG